MKPQPKQRFAVLLTLACVLATGAGVLAQQLPPVPRPVLTSLHPSQASVRSGSASAVVFVAGQNFVNGVSKVEFLGSERATTVFNPEILAFELTQTDLAKPQTVMVTVVNQRGTLALKSNSLPFVVLP